MRHMVSAGADRERSGDSDKPLRGGSWIETRQGGTGRVLGLAVGIAGEVVLYDLLANVTGDSIVAAILTPLPALLIVSWAVNRPGRRN